MDFVTPGYRPSRLSGVEVWHHAEEAADVVARLALLVCDVAAAMEVELGCKPSCTLRLCVYHSNDNAATALGRNVPPTMLMAPRLASDWSLIVCQSPKVDPRNGDWPRMRRHLAHEVAHVMLADLTGGTRKIGDGGHSLRIRSWFDEGFAEVAAAVVCARPDIIERYLATPSETAWSEDELDAALDDIGSPRRPAAFAEAVRRVQAGYRGRTLRDVVHEMEAVARL